MARRHDQILRIALKLKTLEGQKVPKEDLCARARRRGWRPRRARRRQAPAYARRRGSAHLWGRAAGRGGSARCAGSARLGVLWRGPPRARGGAVRALSPPAGLPQHLRRRVAGERGARRPRGGAAGGLCHWAGKRGRCRSASLLCAARRVTAARGARGGAVGAGEGPTRRGAPRAGARRGQRRLFDAVRAGPADDAAPQPG